MDWILTKIVSKMREPSTVRGIITLAGLFGYSLNPSLAEPIALCVGGAIALLEIIRKEGLHGSEAKS